MDERILIDETSRLRSCAHYPQFLRAGIFVHSETAMPQPTTFWARPFPLGKYPGNAGNSLLSLLARITQNPQQNANATLGHGGTTKPLTRRR